MIDITCDVFVIASAHLLGVKTLSATVDLVCSAPVKAITEESYSRLSIAVKKEVHTIGKCFSAYRRRDKKKILPSSILVCAKSILQQIKKPDESFETS